MRSAPEPRRAPRTLPAGALALCRAVRVPLLALLPALLLALLLGGLPLAGQTPPDTISPDTVAPDTLPDDTFPADTIPGDTIPADTLPIDTIPADPVPGDTIPADTAVADTAAAPPLENLPRLSPLVPAGMETAVWEWDREELLANRALTLAELLEQIPGVVALRGGDYGTPRMASALGVGGGGIRVFRDGVEMLPLEGSVPDLARVGLGGLEGVRVRRTGRGFRIELESIRPDDHRPYSLVEAGTGDLDTNLFRGAFVHPTALGGNLGLALDRIDTRGPESENPGSVSSIWLRYSYLRGDRFGVVAEFNRGTSDRDTRFVPGEVTRTDWTLRGRARITDGVVAEAFWNSASLATDSAGPDFEPFPFRTDSRTQLGGALTARRGFLGGRAAVRTFSGEGLADRRISAELSATDAEIGGVAASWSRESWPDRTPTRTLLRGWTAPLYGLSVFGSIEDYERAVPFLPALPARSVDGPGTGPGSERPPGSPELPHFVTAPRFTRGTSTRLGARFRWRGLDLAGARLTKEADTVHPFGLPVDRGGPSLEVDERREGWEIAFRLPLLLDGLALTGSGQRWEIGRVPDTDAPAADPVLSWPYFPRRTWAAALDYHDTFYPTGNLEIWADVGVVGRDRMLVPAAPVEPEGGNVAGPSPEVATVPFYQSWYARLQIRVVTVRVFVTWENFTVREENQDFPGRDLPSTRALYGVRWTLWN